MGGMISGVQDVLVDRWEYLVSRLSPFGLASGLGKLQNH